MTPSEINYPCPQTSDSIHITLADGELSIFVAPDDAPSSFCAIHMTPAAMLELARMLEAAARMRAVQAWGVFAVERSKRETV